MNKSKVYIPVSVEKLSKENLFRIAKLIDNEFNGKDKSFNASRFVGFYLLYTTSCDFCSYIKVFTDSGGITEIQRMGEDTDGYEPVHEVTFDRINNFVQSIS